MKLRLENRKKLAHFSTLNYHEASCQLCGSAWWKTYVRLWWSQATRLSWPNSKTALIARKHRHELCNVGMRLSAASLGPNSNYVPLSRMRNTRLIVKDARNSGQDLGRVENYLPDKGEISRWIFAILDDERPSALAERLDAGLISVSDASIKVLPWVDRQDFEEHITKLLSRDSVHGRQVTELTYFLRLWCYPSSYMRYSGLQMNMPPEPPQTKVKK